ncbi:thioredoxin family protein [Noviherbaspirillum massiliense]|uniref:thioredoxin family protein n=1 Tax=Noviherbaspirillum massiliense TaxID=1465823 RepID=UPI0005506943|nr:thioredoxin family protein [Noviherbaspirillum massiliense]
MSSLTLDSQNSAQLAEWLNDGMWVVACLCAAWCDTCRAYRAGFDALAARHPDKRFIWIDIEDQADLVGDIDVENFPTLLIQRGDLVAFFGTVLPDAKLADRLIQAQAERSMEDLTREANGSEERQEWQRDCNLRARLRASMNEQE